MTEGKKEVVLSKEKQRKANIIKKKLNTAQHPLSVVILPRTKEGHLLTDAVKTFDHVFWFGVRAKIGPMTPPEDVKPYIDKAQKIVLLVQARIGNFSSFKTPEEKYYDARRFRSHVFIPRTQEGRVLAQFVEAVDNRILVAKSCDLSGDGRTSLGDLFFVYDELIALTKEIIRDKKIDLNTIPKKLRSILRPKENEDEASQSPAQI